MTVPRIKLILTTIYQQLLNAFYPINQARPSSIIIAYSNNYTDPLPELRVLTWDVSMEDIPGNIHIMVYNIADHYNNYYNYYTIYNICYHIHTIHDQF